MANELNMSLQKERKRVKMQTRIFILVLLVIICQLLVSTAVLIFGGEFRDLKEYSYNTFVEKTENYSAHIQNELQERAITVQEYAEQINGIVNRILSERGASIADLQKNKDLDYAVIESSFNIVSSLLQAGKANDAYLILETGDLYADEGGRGAKAALYLQGVDPNLDQENDDLLLVYGFSSISENWNIPRHSDWAQYFTPDSEDNENFDFYYTPLHTAKENNLLQEDLGYWSKFSKISLTTASSMKYSIPLIAEDGTIYGILGIGLAGDTALYNTSSYDFLSETICYVLASEDTDTSYTIMARAGATYSSLLGNASTLHISNNEGEGLYNFEMVTDVELTGNVQYLEMQGEDSPYGEESWVLISVADRSSILHSVQFLQRMLIVSAVVSLLIGAMIAVFGSKWILKPLFKLSSLIKTRRKYNEVVRFEPTNIYEVDEITDAITQMQINIHAFSSQVSKMISVADVGLGTFMYDRSDDSVFVGQSLVKILQLNLTLSEDTVMSRREFMDSIENPEVQSKIAAGLGMSGGEIQGDHSEVYEINQLDGSVFWMRLGFTYSLDTAIGTVQDITATMIERTRIEHERDHDNLTGLLSRPAYYRALEKLFHDKDKLKITAFVMIDLDNLKYVNDTYGHSFGDDYIKTTADVLKRFESHGGIVARLSGDEFNICLPGFSSKEEAWEAISGVRNELLESSCLLADGTHFKISASMGVSWYPSDADSYELLMKYADFAMYTVKRSVKGGVAEFDMKSYSKDSDKLTDLEELNRIIEEASVQYAFQSIVSVKTGEIYGYEALMRVQSEIFQSPLEVLNIARTSAKLQDIERLTWTKAMADFQVLLDAGKVEKTARLFVNSIANHKLEDEIVLGLENSYPHLLKQVVMELLESESADEDSTAHKENVVQRWGGQIALDDYGTGYNSEYALLSLEPNIIKIDRSIINGCDQDADRRMIIENLVKLAKAKGIRVLAEGVETEEEMKTVIDCSVDFLQGYYLAYPSFEPGPIDPEVAETIRRMANQNDILHDKNNTKSEEES